VSTEDIANLGLTGLCSAIILNAIGTIMPPPARNDIRDGDRLESVSR
jgi:hypothetical protein